MNCLHGIAGTQENAVVGMRLQNGECPWCLLNTLANRVSELESMLREITDVELEALELSVMPRLLDPPISSGQSQVIRILVSLSKMKVRVSRFIDGVREGCSRCPECNAEWDKSHEPICPFGILLGERP